MKLHFLAVVALAAVSTVAQAQSKPEDQIRLRQGGLQLLAKNVGVLGAVVKGDVPFNKDAVNARAEYINALAADIYGSGFGAGSDKGLPTRANPKIWSDTAGFKAAVDKLTGATKKLEGVPDVAALKTAMGDVAAACKNCHDNFRDSAYH